MNEDFTAKIQYQSEGKTPDGNPFFTVKQSRGYYEYGERGGIDSIAFILWDSNTEKYALINESKPPRDEIEGRSVKMTTAFGGSIDNNKPYQEICQQEVLEESGYEIPLKNIIFVGETLVSSQMSQMCSLYLVDVTGYQKTKDAEHELDNNEFIGNSVKWLDRNELISNCDWKSITIMCCSEKYRRKRIEND